MLIHIHTRSPKRKPRKKSQKQIEAEQLHSEFLKRAGYTGKAKERAKHLPKLSPEPLLRPEIPTSDYIAPVVCAKHTIDDWRWKKGDGERSDTIREIENKKKRVAIAFNKGAYQYISDGDDPTAIGKK